MIEMNVLSNIVLYIMFFFSTCSVFVTSINSTPFKRIVNGLVSMSCGLINEFIFAFMWSRVSGHLVTPKKVQYPLFFLLPFLVPVNSRGEKNLDLWRSCLQQLMAHCTVCCLKLGKLCTGVF